MRLGLRLRLIPVIPLQLLTMPADSRAIVQGTYMMKAKDGVVQG